MCEHGKWTFAGADFKRKATKWRCPTGECRPASVWVKASRLHPIVPRETRRFRDLYRGREAVEWAFGRLKNEYGTRTSTSESGAAIRTPLRLSRAPLSSA